MLSPRRRAFHLQCLRTQESARQNASSSSRPRWLTVNVWPATVTVPDRLGSLFIVTSIVTVPLPVPLDGSAVIQGTLLTARHEQPAAVVTVNDGAGLPALFTEALDELSEYVQLGATAAAWLTVNVCPSTVMTPDRGLDAVLPATANDTTPSPLPVGPPEKVIQSSRLVALHPHPLGAMTLKDPDPPAAAIGEATPVGFSRYVQDGAAVGTDCQAPHRRAVQRQDCLAAAALKVEKLDGSAAVLVLGRNIVDAIPSDGKGSAVAEAVDDSNLVAATGGNSPQLAGSSSLGVIDELPAGIRLGRSVRTSRATG